MNSVYCYIATVENVDNKKIYTKPDSSSYKLVVGQFKKGIALITDVCI